MLGPASRVSGIEACASYSSRPGHLQIMEARLRGPASISCFVVSKSWSGGASPLGLGGLGFLAVGLSGAPLGSCLGVSEPLMFFIVACKRWVTGIRMFW